jgi:hypothetical protein
VHSGHGWHVYWLIKPTCDWDFAERTLKGLRRWLGADKTSIAQSLRLPGSLNCKVDRPLTQCVLGELHPMRRYTLADFSPYALAPLSIPQTPPVSPIGTDTAPIIACLRQRYGGYLRASGWVAACCPLGHRHDFPGSHFNFHPSSAYAYCFGRHQHIDLPTLYSALGFVKG